MDKLLNPLQGGGFFSSVGSCPKIRYLVRISIMDKDSLWVQAQKTIKVSISPANFSTWFSQTFLSSIKKIGKGRQVVEIACPSAFIADTLERRYFGLIQDTISEVAGIKTDLVFVIKQLPVKHLQNGDETPLFSLSDEDEQKDGANDLLKKARVRAGFTFENFAVSSSNQMAWAAATSVANNLGSSYNPLFVWGGVGVGKTHLMLAVAHRVLATQKSAKVLYCMSEEFTTEIIEAIRTKNTPFFKKRYRSLDLLLLDDVQFLAGKTAVQEEFFHTFNTILREGGQVILTSDRPPSEISRLEERLVSRFEAGLIVDISDPDFELRTAILLIKAQERGVSLTPEVAQLVAGNIEKTRQLEGFLVRLVSEATTRRVAVTPELAQSLLGKTRLGGNGVSLSRPQPSDYIASVSSYFSIGKRQLLGGRRARPVVVPRQVLMYLLRVDLGLPLQEVGRLVGGRDHTTVIHAVEKISKELSTNNDLRRDILGIKKRVSG